MQMSDLIDVAAFAGELRGHDMDHTDKAADLIEAQARELVKLRGIVSDIPELVTIVVTDCDRERLDGPCIYQRGDRWRYHAVRAGNQWEDGDTPIQAARAVEREY